MSRKSPIHYIAPSGISISPNANNSANDLAVYVAKECKIKVYSPAASLGMTDVDYQTWTISGRNRRLVDDTGSKAYTIYARLPKGDDEVARSKGYIVFAAKDMREETHEGRTIVRLVDRYCYVTADGITPQGYNPETGTWGPSVLDNENWYIRLGEVSAVRNGQRTVELDTGILGTDQFNTEWALNPDALPLRIDLSCTINDEDVGLTPYVHWEEQMQLAAILTEGWTGTDIQRFNHWEIFRNSGNGIDTNWPSEDRKAAFGVSGEITLTHSRDTNDDFNNAVACIFTIVAMQKNPDYIYGTESTDEVPMYIPLKQTQLTVLAETVEHYDMQMSASVMGFNPASETYTPSEGINITLRATDQKGEMSDLSRSQITAARLAVSYAPVGSDVWAEVTFAGGAQEVAVANIPASAFAGKQNVNVRLTREMDVEGEEATLSVELTRSTIAFVRDGEDSREREWIFLRSATAITFGGITSEHPLPSLITGGEVQPHGAAGDSDTNKNQDDWVPQGWWDDMQGTTDDYPFEYGAYRDYVHATADADGHWGDFSVPTIQSHYGKDGVTIRTVEVFKAAPTQPATPTGSTIPPSGWSLTPPTTLGTGEVIWSSVATFRNDTLQGSWSSPVQWAGKNGDRGDDAYSVSVEPANMIFTQSTVKDDETGEYPLDIYTQYAHIIVRKGNSTEAVPHTYLRDKDNERAIHCTIGSQIVNDTVAISGILPGEGEEWTTGSAVLTVQITDGPSFKVQINVYYNLLGTWKENVEGGVETISAEQISYVVNNGDKTKTIQQSKSAFNSVRSAAGAFEQWRTNTYAYDITNINTQINTATQSISMLQSQMNGTEDSALKTSISQIKQTADNINLSVNSSFNNFLLKPKATDAIKGTTTTYIKETNAMMGEVVRISNAVSSGDWQLDFVFDNSRRTQIGSSSMMTAFVVVKNISAGQLHFGTWSASYHYPDLLVCSANADGTIDSVSSQLADDATAEYTIHRTVLANGWNLCAITFLSKRIFALNITNAGINSVGNSVWQVFGCGIIASDTCPTLETIITNIGVASAGIDITAGNIRATADNFSIWNNSGERTFEVNEEGSITSGSNHLQLKYDTLDQDSRAWDWTGLVASQDISANDESLDLAHIGARIQEANDGVDYGRIVLRALNKDGSPYQDGATQIELDAEMGSVRVAALHLAGYYSSGDESILLNGNPRFSLCLCWRNGDQEVTLMRPLREEPYVIWFRKQNAGWLHIKRQNGDEIASINSESGAVFCIYDMSQQLWI